VEKAPQIGLVGRVFFLGYPIDPYYRGRTSLHRSARTPDGAANECLIERRSTESGGVQATAPQLEVAGPSLISAAPLRDRTYDAPDLSLDPFEAVLDG